MIGLHSVSTIVIYQQDIPLLSSKESKIRKMLDSMDLTNYGFSYLKEPFSLSFYEQWIEAGKHGEMEFLKNHLPQKKDPSLLLGEAKSAIVIAQNYAPHPEPVNLGFKNSEIPKVALFARGEDYHRWLKAKCDQIIEELSKMYPKEQFVSFTDSAPVLERDLAHRAGLGWVGKNTCLIHPQKGSLFFIAEIFTTMSLQAEDQLVPDRCGTCTKCIDICPTNALTERELDATKCISYWTIEAKEIAPKDLRSNFGSWYFGCDICQSVCPWNKKVFGKEFFGSLQDQGVYGAEDELSEEKRNNLIDDLKWILTSSNKKIQKRFLGTALSRASGNSHKRNSLYLVENFHLKELKPEIEHLASTTKNESLISLSRLVLSNLEL
ncbi:MAG: tRNA epoxyqueuosine(34) reductase QueG [Bdellovibrionales bacterium]